MKVLVTGGAGYIGSHVVKVLARAGHDVVTLDNLGEGHRRAVVSGRLVVGDLKDRSLVEELLVAEKVEAVIHLAAHSIVPESVVQPEKYFRNNLLSGLNLLDAMLASGCRYLVFSSSAAVYGEPERVPIEEDHPTSPTNPYGESKLFFEAILRRYEEAHGLRFISLRYFNAAGADPEGELGEDHDPETHLVPIILQTALGLRSAVRIFGTDYPTPDGTCIRDYIHVSDLAEAHLLALNALRAGKHSSIYNLGNGEGFSVREVLQTAEQVVGRLIPAVEAPRRPGDPAVLVASSERAQKELGWQPRYADLRVIIRTAWNWHRNHPAGYGE